MVTDLLNDEVFDDEGDRGTVRGLYMDGTTVMAIVESQESHNRGGLYCIQLTQLTTVEP